MILPHLVVEHLGGGTGQRAETEVAEMREVLLEPESERRRALPDLERRERVDVDAGYRLLDRAHDAGVVVARERRMDPALQADLGRASLPRLARTADDLLERDEIRRAAQVPRELPLREGAEPTAEVADVGVLDVPGDDVRDLVPAGLAAEPVRGGEDAVQLVPARLEQAGELLLAELVPGVVERCRVASHDEGDRAGLAGRPRVVAREP